jgi:hypothetical protein
MTRPLLISDCDEVLLHMVRHFGTWMRERHDMHFAYDTGSFVAITTADGTPVDPARAFEMLDQFFPAEMERQTLVPGAADALAVIGAQADIVILTNLGDHCRDHRVTQLAAHGINHRVETNRGGKGDPVARLVAEYGNPVTVFVDDLAVHHESVAKHAPSVHRLHLVAEPAMAHNVPPAPFAHARIDNWEDARRWIVQRFADNLPADTEGMPA